MDQATGDFWAAMAQVLEGPIGAVLAGVWGALWGSFYNVVVARLPGRESLIRPPSHCRACRTPLRWYDNVPVLSYVLLRGRCRHCGARYSVRYVVLEVLVAALAVALHHVFVTAGVGPIGQRAAQFTITSLFAGLLCAIAAIDLQTMRIPNAITYPSIPVAVALSLLMGHVHWWDGLVGAVGGYLSIRLVADGYEWLTGRQGMGYGDAKLLAMIGGLLGWQVLLPALFLASLQGSVIGISALVIVRVRRGAAAGDDAPKAAGDDPAGQSQPAAETQMANGEHNDATGQQVRLRHARIPFGPFLSLAAIELLLLHWQLPGYFPYLY